MRPNPVKHQNKYITTYLINQQPVRLNVAFPGAFIITRKFVISIFRIQHSAIRQNINYIKQFIKIPILLFSKFKSFLN